MARKPKTAAPPDVIIPPAPTAPEPPVAASAAVAPPVVASPPTVPATAPATTPEGGIEISEVVIVKTGEGNSATGTYEGKYDVVEVTLIAVPVVSNTLDRNLSISVARSVARSERAKRGGLTRGLI